MTTITIAETRDEQRYAVQLTAEGHADYDRNERDIVCAACSMLTQALARSVQEQERYGLLEKAQYVEGDGRAMLTATVLAGSPMDDVLRGMLTVAATGYEMLAEEYPQNVRLLWQGRKSQNDLIP